MSPTERTLKLFRSKGFRCEVVEKIVPGTFIKRDLFGFGDVEAVGGPDERYGFGYCSWLLQATDDTNHAKRRTKIVEDCREAAQDVIRGGIRVAVVSWGQRGGRGEKKRWTARIEEITLADVR